MVLVADELHEASRDDLPGDAERNDQVVAAFEVEVAELAAEMHVALLEEPDPLGGLGRRHEVDQQPDEAERMVEVKVEAQIPFDQMTDEQKAEKRKRECDEAYERHAESVEAIKAAIDAEDWTGMTEAWGEIPQEDQLALYLAPSKGGVFTTFERKCVKENQVRETAHVAT